MYKTVHTDSYREEYGYRIDIHYVHTENGYHYDAALWQTGVLIDDKGEFATRVEAIRWAQGQIKSAEQDKEPAPTTAAYVTPHTRAIPVQVQVSPAVTFADLREAEQLEHEAHCALMDATEVGVSTMDYNAAVGVYREAYLRVCELASVLGRRTAIANGNDADVAERIGSCYTMVQSPRMEAELFVRLYNMLCGYCGQIPIDQDFMATGYVDQVVKSVKFVDLDYRTVDADTLHRSASVIVLDLDIWGIPKQGDEQEDDYNHRRWDGYPDDYDPSGGDIPF